MLFMVIETFKDQDALAVYERLHESGRKMPDGLRFIQSWVSADVSRCFQLMETDDLTTFQRWIAEWQDVMGFEVVPVTEGKQTAITFGAAH
jgi:hypothetical protein